MLLTLDFSSDIPIYIQLRNQIVLGIAEGRLSPGERLPSVRALAEESGINMMTVSKGYQLLKQEGYIKTTRRGGAVVCAAEGERVLRPETAAALRLAISEMKLAGFGREEILAVCGEIYGEDEK